ncbi:apolipoprotein N-acyltransferase [Vibrio sp. SCSIO 43137]|uniref:apolipoprotein N-acyltransferase n=1 Tax=Vibrio sp. SCSIO 43137 TaxID=3021011 RepID=UPI0023073608|nr:apolipoprotein N-acyltransferase [Vibrio sp. SCSIO 43137]WCE28354.1 apolipoprotein N-acyltransferase [Vibrio sp. SCSIO 43137]
MWWLGIIAGVANALSYRLESIGLLVVLASFFLIFLAHLRFVSLTGQCTLWFLFGLGYYLTSLFWVNGYLAYEYGDASWIRWGLWPLIILILSISFVIVPLASFKLSSNRTLIAVPFILVSIDILREQSAFSFSWLHPGFLALDFGLSGWLSVVGAFGVSFIVYVFAGLLVWFCVNHRCLVRSATTLLIAVFAVFVLDKVAQLAGISEQAPDQVKVRIIHGNFAGTHKLSQNDVIERVQRYISLSLQAPRVDIAIWPESSMSMPYEEIAPFVQQGLQKLDDKNVTAIWGGQARNGQHLQNVIYQSGHSKPIYYKQRLVPFGEYRPAWFVDWIERVTLSRGGDIQVIANTRNEHVIGDLNAVLAVCYEALYSDAFTSKLDSGNVALLLSDVEWTHTPWVKRFLLRLARVRAAEVGKAIVNSTNQGFTALIGPDGEVVSQVTTAKTQVLDVVVPLVQKQTFYTRYGHQWLLWLSAVVLLLLYTLNRYELINLFIAKSKRSLKAY